MVAKWNLIKFDSRFLERRLFHHLMKSFQLFEGKKADELRCWRLVPTPILGSALDAQKVRDVELVINPIKIEL